jgi:hypothetical protein
LRRLRPPHDAQPTTFTAAAAVDATSAAVTIASAFVTPIAPVTSSTTVSPASTASWLHLS